MMDNFNFAPNLLSGVNATDPLAGMSDPYEQAKKDPQYIADQQRLPDLQKAENARRASYAQSLDEQANRPIKEQEAPDFEKEAGPRPEFKDYAVKQTPFLMIAMAALGKGFHTSGLGMLKAQTGMLQGLQSGSMESFSQASTAYEQHLKDMTDKWKNQQLVADRMEKALGNRINAKSLAYQLAREATGDTTSDMKNIVGNYAAAAKAFEKMNMDEWRKASFDARTDLMARRIQISADRVAIAQDSLNFTKNKNVNQLTQNLAGIKTAQDYTAKLKTLLPILAERYKNVPPLPGGIGELARTYINDIELQDFNADVKDLKAAISRAGLSGRVGNKLLDELSSGKVANLFQYQPEQLRQLIENEYVNLQFFEKQTAEQVKRIAPKSDTPKDAEVAPKRIQVDKEGNVLP